MATRHTSHRTLDFVLETFLTQLLQPSVEQLNVRMINLPTDCSVEQIHQSRVLIRTLRAQLDTFDSLLKQHTTASVTKQLKWLDSLLAPLRNTDVTAELLASQPMHIPDSLHEKENFKAYILQHIIDQREQQVHEVLEKIKGPEVPHLRSELATLISEPPMRMSVVALSTTEQLQLVTQCLNGEKKELLRLAKQTKRNPSRRRLHKVRIQAKQVRYSYVAAQSQSVISDEATITFSGKLHKLLGKHQDVVIVEAWLKDLTLETAAYSHLRRYWLNELKRRRQRIIRKYGKLLETTFALRQNQKLSTSTHHKL